MTTHKAQGATIPCVYVLLGGSLQDRHLSYVQLTRASESTRLYVDKHHAGTGQRQLVKDMERLRAKVLAIKMLATNESDEYPGSNETEEDGSDYDSAKRYNQKLWMRS